MQSISVVFSTLHRGGYIADLTYRWLITSGSARWLIEIYSPFEKHEAWRTVNRKTIAFGGTTRSSALTMHKFMNENLRVNIWRENFTSDYLRVNLPSRNLSRIRQIKATKLSTLSEPSIVKFIENQREHLSKLTLHHL